MENVVNWLKENLGDNVQIMTPQFERKEKLEFEYIPSTPEQFQAIVDKAPWDILKGMGFRKWDTMNNVIGENKDKHVSNKISIPIINAPEGENYEVECGRGEAPIEELTEDQDIILIPGEWYNAIPNGFIVTGLYGEKYPFEKGKSDDDIRFGCLPYGITRAVAKKV